MKARNVITGVLSIGAVASFGIWLAVAHQYRLRLDREHQDLERKLGQMAVLIAENGRLSNRVAGTRLNQSLPDDWSRELLRLRGQVGVLRQQSKELESARQENLEVRARLTMDQDAGVEKTPPTADYWPRDSWAFTGYVSPDAGLQTSLWAANSGDLKTLLTGSTGEFHQMLEKQFEGKSETEASIRAMDEVCNLKSVRVMNREFQDQDTVVLTAAFEDKTDTYTTKLVMKKIGNDWKLSGPR